jgi:hypothetical protein
MAWSPGCKVEETLYSEINKHGILKLSTTQEKEMYPIINNTTAKISSKKEKPPSTTKCVTFPRSIQANNNSSRHTPDNQSTFYSYNLQAYNEVIIVNHEPQK